MKRNGYKNGKKKNVNASCVGSILFETIVRVSLVSQTKEVV